MPSGGRRVGAGRKAQPGRELRHIRATDAEWSEIREYAREVKSRPIQPQEPQKTATDAEARRPGMYFPVMRTPDDFDMRLWTYAVWQLHGLAAALGMPALMAWEWAGDPWDETCMPDSDYKRQGVIIAACESYMNAHYSLKGHEWAITEDGFGLWPKR